ncbi:hypothetical protein KUTeg_001717 [Tegillarca granosa]|uniref:Uncharacterized protein n=1 Tax=Tegillarca granosa TaxID=220873 RepID=A0ABQ9FWK5_TEGGR|nr:hypothetical protein KUTeg_001717 [Tegillarca granosa]
MFKIIKKKMWKHGLLGCFDNLGLCIVTYLIPCYTFGKNAEAIGEGCCCCALTYMFPIIHLVAAVNIRGRIREQQNIEGTMCNDLIIVAFCPFCALVQEAQELRGEPLSSMGMAHLKMRQLTTNYIELSNLKQYINVDTLLGIKLHKTFHACHIWVRKHLNTIYVTSVVGNDRKSTGSGVYDLIPIPKSTVENEQVSGLMGDSS